MDESGLGVCFHAMKRNIQCDSKLCTVQRESLVRIFRNISYWFPSKISYNNMQTGVLKYPA
jgi:hypothetical protein